MFKNLGLHTELLAPLPVTLLIAGAILGYGAKIILRLMVDKPSDNAILLLKVVGLVLALAGVVMIFLK